MSNADRNQRDALSRLGRQRRLFVQKTAFAAAGASAAAMLATEDARAQPRAGKEAPLICPEVKIPLRDVAGKVAFITGGSSGIGLGMATVFAEAGMKVALGYHSQKSLDSALPCFKAMDERVRAIQIDVTDRSQVAKAAAETVKVFGKVHLLVNNAGVSEGAGSTPLIATSYEYWDKVVRVNLDGVFNGIHAFLPHLEAHGEGGQIVTTASMWGLAAVTNAAAYSASKAAVIALSEALRGELFEKNIGVSVYCPGWVNSELGCENRPAPRMQPVEAGRRVLRGIRNNDLYILSHREYEPAIRAREEALIASIPEDLPTPDAKTQALVPPEMYDTFTKERDRRRCARKARR